MGENDSLKDPRLDPNWAGETVVVTAENLKVFQYWPYIEVEDSTRSKRIRWLGTLGAYYLFGDETNPTRPELPGRLTDFGERLFSVFRSGLGDDLPGSNVESIAAVAEITRDLPRLGIPSMDTLEWMLEGMRALILDEEAKRLGEAKAGNELSDEDLGNLATERMIALYGPSATYWTNLLKTNREFAEMRLDESLPMLKEAKVAPLSYLIELMGFATQAQALAEEFQRNALEALTGHISGRPPALTERDREAAYAYWAYHVPFGKQYDSLRRALFPDLRRHGGGDINKGARKLVEHAKSLIRELPDDSSPKAGATLLYLTQKLSH